MSEPAAAKYQDLMQVIRFRLDYIRALKTLDMLPFIRAETAAFHGRKIIEGIAFACLTTIENSMKEIPRDAVGQWNARNILNSLQRKNLETAFPSPSIIRKPTDEEIKENGWISATIEGQPHLRMTIEDLVHVYERLHGWLHEINPYTNNHKDYFQKNENVLWDDLEKVDSFIDKHTLSIKGEMFFCVLRDSVDGQTKVTSLSKTS